MLNESSPEGWTVVVPTRGDALSACAIRENIVARLEGVPILVVRNGTDLDARAWSRLARCALVEIVDQPGGGVARARNAALTAVEARTLVFVDDDVIVTGAALRRLVARQRFEGAVVSAARVVPAPTEHHPLFDDDLGFDRGPRSNVWHLTDDCETPVSPLMVWQFGVGATFAVDLELLEAGCAARFDERLSNGRFCGGSEDVDFFYTVYRAGSRLNAT